MNPYLEHPALWPEVHYGLISCLMRALNPQIIPKYRAAVEKRVYQDALLVGVADTAVVQKVVAADTRSPQLTAVVSQPERVSVPILEEVTERYLEIRDIVTNRVITVIEVLSPKNKRSGEGRNQYLRKRQSVLSSSTHLVEIDLLRAGEPMPIGGGRTADYQILVSRAGERPQAQRYPFDLRDSIPRFLLPLQVGDAEPIVDLGQLINQVCEEAALDLSIDYTQPPTPPLQQADLAWLQTL